MFKYESMWATARSLCVPIAACAADDRFDDLALGIGVVLDVDPAALRELALGALVEQPIRLVAPQPVPEHQHALDLVRGTREHMEVHVRVGPLENPVLVPVGFADA